ncbi:MAG: low molecular weight protein-tyrosine-phosphatase [Usitatibacter sp.]
MRAILFVCTANICRSPMAEGVLRKLLADEHIEKKFEIDSVGTHDYQVGKAPSPDAIEAAKKRGYDINHLVSRKIKPGDFDHFDYILGMDKSNIKNLKTIAPTRCKQKIELLLEYGDKYQGKEIPDPFGKKGKDFELALDMIEDGCGGLVELLKKTAAR